MGMDTMLDPVTCDGTTTWLKMWGRECGKWSVLEILPPPPKKVTLSNMTKTTRASNCVWLFLRKTININPFYVRPLLVYLEIKGQHSRRCHKDVTNLRMDIMYNMCSMINLSETFLSISMSVSKDFLICPKYRLTLNHCQISCYYSCGRIEQ